MQDWSPVLPTGLPMPAFDVRLTASGIIVPSHRRAIAIMIMVLLAAAVALVPGSGWAATYFVRPDGGSARECDGRADRARAADGNCAWAHPFVALPPGGRPRLTGGDTLIIGTGNYRMGIDAPDTERCHPEYSWDCHMPPLPSGTAERPTRVLGAGHDAGCPQAPELWGSERAAMIINLTDTRHAHLACLEITDRSGCIEFHCHGGGCEGMIAACQRDQPPFGDWASTGLLATGARDITLSDLHIHGLGNRGVLAGGLADWRLERVRIIANGWSGWDGDVGEHSANSGRLEFEDVEIAYNGCVQTWPQGEITGCWAQGAGGYGDGLGTARTGGEWVFERAQIHHNTSDGLDLLYLDDDARVRINASLFEGNAGNQLKISGSAIVSNSVIIGNCARFVGQGNFAPSDHCRAAGDAVFLGLGAQINSALINNTITGEGNCLVSSAGDAGGRILMSNNLFVGQPAHGQSRQSCLFWSGQKDLEIEWRSNQVSRAYHAACTPGQRCLKRAGIASTAIDAFDPTPAADSPLVGQASVDGDIKTDFRGRPRPAPGKGRTIGALEPVPADTAAAGFRDGISQDWLRLPPERPADGGSDGR